MENTNPSADQVAEKDEFFNATSVPKQPALMASKRFLPLFCTQFFAAFSDNYLKTTLSLLVLAVISGALQHSLISLASVVFIFPFAVLSALGGQIADKYEKSTLIRLLKAVEVIAALVSAIAIFYSSVTLLFIGLFFFGIGSALFGPVKYAILPEHVDNDQLPKANAWIEGATFFAIILGTLIASITISTANHQPNHYAGILIIVFSVLSFLSSLKIPKSSDYQFDASVELNANIFKSTFSLVKALYQDKKLFTVALIISWFWLVGAILLSLIPLLTKQLGDYRFAIPYFLTLFAIAISIGSAIAAWMCAGRIVLLHTVLGTIICGLACIDMGFTVSRLPHLITVSRFSEFFSIPGIIHLSIDFIIIAIAGAFLVVPGNTALQAWAKPEKRARVIAANNILNALFMVVGGIVVAFFQNGGFSANSLFTASPIHAIAFGLGVTSLIAAFFMFKYLPSSALRDFITILFRAFFRLEVKGLDHFKEAGDTPIIALNHVSFLDGMLALALCDSSMSKMPAFAVNKDIAELWWVKPFIKPMNGHPIDPTHPLETRTLIRSIEEGTPLVIFPEGRITVTGGLMKIYDGAAMIADKTGAKILPIKIDGLERTPFSRLHDWQVHKKLFPKVKVTITKPVTLNLDPELSPRTRRSEAGNQLYEIMSDLVFTTSQKTGTLFEELVQASKNSGLRAPAMEDPFSGIFTYRKLLTGVRLLAKALQPLLQTKKPCGLLLANSNTTAVSFFALQSLAIAPAMINFSAGIATIIAATKAANLSTIITSKTFIEQAQLEELIAALQKENIKFIYLEDVKPTFTRADKLQALFLKRKPVVKQAAFESPAVILFTSGSEGTPKGVVLSHKNILANCAQAAARIDFSKNDKLFNMLPMFHSFGLTVGTLVPLLYGVPVCLYPSPLHYRIIPEVIYNTNATIIFGTDTFLNGYARMGHPYDFRSIRYCFSGAEPVKESTRNLMMDKFGIRILEGYGVTEAAPVIALNTPMYQKRGSVGRLMPHIKARLEPVDGIDEGGRLFIKGPNIMMGYLKVDKPGVLQPLKDGWHDTGDIVIIDEEGFVRIVGRVKRFAKLGGEMVSLTAVENFANKLWPDFALAVVAIHDERKGEKLVLISENKAISRAPLLAYAKEQGIPELYVPNQFIVAELPLLGSGKLDYPALKEIAENN